MDLEKIFKTKGIKLAAPQRAIKSFVENQKSQFCEIDVFAPNETTLKLRQTKFQNSLQDDFEVEFDLENQTYHQHSFLSSSKVLSVFGKTEIEAKKAIGVKIETTAAMELGNVVHDIIEQIAKKNMSEKDLDKMLENYVVAPTFTMNKTSSIEEGIEFYGQYFEDGFRNQLIANAYNVEPNGFKAKKSILAYMVANCKQAIKGDHFAAIRATVKELKRLPYLITLIRNSISEMSVFDTEGKKRLRPDCFIPKSVYGTNIHLSIKTTGDLSRYNRFKDRYNIQTGMYDNILCRAVGTEDIIQLVCIIELRGGIAQIKVQEFSKKLLGYCATDYKNTLARFEHINTTDAENLKGYEQEFKNKYGVELL